MKRVLKFLVSWQFIIGIQIVTSIAVFAYLWKLGVLPIIYSIMIIVVLAILGALTYFLMKPSRKIGKGKIRNILGKIISVCLSIVMILGCLYIGKSYNALNGITSPDSETTHFAVYVLKDSHIKSLKDIKNESVEYCLNYDEAKDMNVIISKMKQVESSLIPDELENYATLADDLYNNTVHAILVNTAYDGIFEEKHDNFKNEVREIWSYNMKTKVKDFSKKVDVTKDTFSIYISGIDTSGPVSTVSRSDVNMILTVNPVKKQILMTSIPRDYYVTLSNLNQKDKLTHSGLDGIENTVKTAEKFLNVDINYYARVNFTSLIKMVDALGGIDIYSDRALGYGIVEGMNHVDGKTALSFARERHAYAEGDFHRVQNQQTVLTAMLNKAMSPAVITNYSSFLSAISDSFETNMTSEEITKLVQMQLNGMSSWTIMHTQMTGQGVMQTGGAYMPNSNLYYCIPDESSVSKTHEYISKMQNGEAITVDQSEQTQ